MPGKTSLLNGREKYCALIGGIGLDVDQFVVLFLVQTCFFAETGLFR
jgi:hypothetical protein